jgi:hypothetical protein
MNGRFSSIARRALSLFWDQLSEKVRKLKNVAPRTFWPTGTPPPVPVPVSEPSGPTT